jgi:hypothetical protein
VAVSTKLGGLALFAVVCALALYLLRRDVSWRVRAVVFTLPVLIVAGWMIRGVVLSGWLIFPVFGRLPLTWSVRAKPALAHLREIESWSRIFGKGPDVVFAHGFWGWFPTWFDGFRTARELPLLLGSVAALTWRVARGPARLAVRNAAYWAAVAACALGVAQWFVGAPDLRYGAFLFWLLAAVMFAPPLARAMRDPSLRVFVVAMALALCYWSGGFGVQLGLVPPAFDRPYDPPVAPTVEADTGSGSLVHVPTASDQCWDAPLPCAPSPVTAVRRNPADLGAGFIMPRKKKP